MSGFIKRQLSLAMTIMVLFITINNSARQSNKYLHARANLLAYLLVMNLLVVRLYYMRRKPQIDDSMAIKIAVMEASAINWENSSQIESYDYVKLSSGMHVMCLQNNYVAR